MSATNYLVEAKQMLQNIGAIVHRFDYDDDKKYFVIVIDAISKEIIERNANALLLLFQSYVPEIKSIYKSTKFVELGQIAYLSSRSNKKPVDEIDISCLDESKAKLALSMIK